MSTRAILKSRNKKPMETTLGKAPPNCDDPVDLAHIQKPIETSIFGLKHVLTLFETATDEVQRYVMYECDVMYECRICRTIFRSLANFILHKRNYCTELFMQKSHTKSENNVNTDRASLNNCSTIPPADNSKVLLKLNDTAELVLSKTNKKNLNYVIDRLQEKQKNNLITEQCLFENVSNNSKSFLENEGLKDITLHKIADSKVCDFQTMCHNRIKEFPRDLMKTQVMEIHSILDNNEAILGADGKVISSENANLTCTVCNSKFATKNTLIYHIKYKHNNTRMVYQCPDCIDKFANARSVFRHLYKVHRKTTSQVRKLRNQIHANVIQREDQLQQNNATYMDKNDIYDLQLQEDIENQQWINDLEGDNDLQRCGGCGRKFERKAALHSHSQFCSKRIALCNSIRISNTRRMLAEEKQFNKTHRNIATSPANLETTVKGSKRRKPLVAYKMFRVDYPKSQNVNIANKSMKCIRPEREEETKSKLFNSSEIDDKGISCTDKGLVKNLNEEFSLDVLQHRTRPAITSSDVIYVDTVKFTPDTDYLLIENKNMDKFITDFHDTNNTNAYANNTFQAGLSLKSANNAEVKDNKIENVLNNNMLDTNVTSTEIKLPNIEYGEKINKVESLNTKTANVLVKNTNHREVTLLKKSLKYIDRKKFICKPCEKKFKSHKMLMKHMSMHFNWYRYQCNICCFMSYSKVKCNQHMALQDGATHKSTIVPLPSSTVVNESTEFVELHQELKKKETNTNEFEEVSCKVISEEQHCKDQKIEQRENVKTQMDSFKPNVEDPLVRKMIMEVIFGSESSNSEENKISVASVIEKNSDASEDFHGFRCDEQCETATIPLQAANLKDKLRPVRNRIPTVKKDFLYDMTQILKSKGIKEREMRIGECSKETELVKKQKHIKTYSKVKNFMQGNSMNNKKFNGINRSAEQLHIKNVQGISTSNENLKKHVTGDYD